MHFDDVTARLLKLAREHGGQLTAGVVEADDALASDHAITSAAAHALAGSTNVFGAPRESSGWFPYEELRFTELR
jgi:hypothetical protein